MALPPVVAASAAAVLDAIVTGVGNVWEGWSASRFNQDWDSEWNPSNLEARWVSTGQAVSR